MNNSIDIGLRLRTVMAQKGITIAQLAELSELSEDTIKAIRSGKTKNPTISVIIAIADAMNVTLDGFLHRSSLSIEEIFLLRDYKMLNSHGKMLIQTMVESEKIMQAPKDCPTRKIACIIPTNVTTDGVNFGMHDIQYLDVPAEQFPNAVTGLKIISRNLYPNFMKGDVLAIERIFPPLGSIGMFVDKKGMEFIRKYEEHGDEMHLVPVNGCGKTFIYTNENAQNLTCLGTIIGIFRTAEELKSVMPE